MRNAARRLVLPAALALALAFQVCQPPPAPADLPAAVFAAHPERCVLREKGGAVWFSTAPQAPEELNAPAVGRERAADWRGVLKVWPARDGDPLEAERVASWGEYGARRGRWLVFGDPAMVRQALR